jgi:hypothetical protein
MSGLLIGRVVEVLSGPEKDQNLLTDATSRASDRGSTLRSGDLVYHYDCADSGPGATFSPCPVRFQLCGVPALRCGLKCI